MVKKVITLVSAAAVLAAAGSMIYADACGVFLRDNEGAKKLIDKYMTTIMKSYSGESDVSYRGIVKEGCDFWYFNDYNNDVICKASTDAGTAAETDYSVAFNTIIYSDRCYTIDADVTQEIKFDGCDPIRTTSRHIFTIEQSGRDMYITNDVSDGSDTLLVPAELIDTPELPKLN